MMNLMRLSFLLFLTAWRVQGQEVLEYGADISFPMHYADMSTNYAWLPHNLDPSLPVPDEYKDMPVQPLGNKKEFFDNYIQGCVKSLGKQGKICLQNEVERLEMSLRQPHSMRNFTSMGFAKIRAPEHVFSLIKEFWEKNKDRATDERWPKGNVYVNHWHAPTTFVSVEDPAMDGGGYVLKQHIWNAARDTIEEWTGQQVAECSLYGIRVYHEGHVLAPHVDRLPLVSSAIINVDQDVDEPWVLEVIGHDGKAHNITMEPGDMVLYESHSIIHGRPFPLVGRYYANVFIHFEPVGPVGGPIEYNGDLPPYVIPGSPEEENWRRRNPGGHKIMGDRKFETGSTDAHFFAQTADKAGLEKLLDRKADAINARDKNGWTPLHEAVRSGDLDVVRLLLDRGANVNARIHPDGTGASVLWMAHNQLGKDHPVSKLLESRQAKIFEPEL